MSQRFGGQFSPSAKSDGQAAQTPPHPFKGKVPTRLGMMVNLLFVVPWIFVLKGFFSETMGLALNLAAFAALMAGAWLTREGIKAQAAYDAREVAKRPAIPRKLFGSVVTGLGVGLAALWSDGMGSALVLGPLAAVLHGFAFGLDPLKDKGIDKDDFQSSRVARAVDNAEAELAAMLDAVKPIGDRRLLERVEAFHITAREMFRAVERDPRDLTAARRYLGVYLTGAREASEKFASYYARTKEAEARASYLALLDDLEQNFSMKTSKLLEDDRTNMDIEVEVLRERLARDAATLTTGTET
ncbi:MAG: 5-bromo-4-chloroindolyl phosphate hydrolysis family protein [Pseudomonadota bacterium]